MGESNHQFERKVRKQFKESIEKQSPVETSSVKILVDAVPEGIVYSNGQISVKDGYKHNIIGKFNIYLDKSELEFQNRLWVFNYESLVGNILCNIQTPFKIVTLSFWVLLSPTYLPCHPEFIYNHEQANTDIARLSLIAGGDLVITSYEQRIPYDIDKDPVVYSSSGFIIKMDPRMKGKGKLKTTPKNLKKKSDDQII